MGLMAYDNGCIPGFDRTVNICVGRGECRSAGLAHEVSYGLLVRLRSILQMQSFLIPRLILAMLSLSVWISLAT